VGSIYQLSKLKRMPSGAWKGRKAIPQAVRVEYQRLYGAGVEAIFWSPAGTAAQEAKARYAEWQALIQRRVTALQEAGAAGRGQHLTQRQAHALAGQWYRWFVRLHEENPGECSHWAELHEVWWNSLIDTAGDPETGEIDMRAPEVREELHPLLAREARTEQFLTDRGLALSQQGRDSFLSAVFGEFLEATKTLQRRAGGDWGPDQREAKLAPADHSLSVIQKGVADTLLGKAKVRGTSALAATELFQAYVADKHPAPRTVSRWQGVFTALDAAGWQAPDWDAQGWLDSLKTEKRPDGAPVRKPITVRDIWLGAARAVFTWAVRHKKAAHNPFAGCVVEVPRAKVTRETGRAFTEAEALTILRAALNTPIDPKQPFTAAKRWVPWIAAYTGARAGELTQLRRQDVESRPGVGWVIRITPEAGTVKTGEVRVVPPHADLVKQGFAAWAERQPSGPLFHHRPAKPSRNPSYRGPAVKAAERLAKWVRSLGVDHPDVKPNHGWRHTFKSRAIQAGIDARVRDAIVGHAPRTVADAYEHPTVADMAEALRRFQRYAADVEPRRGESERHSSATTA
jgi:integrase